MAIKIDLEKAYDKIEWRFIQKMLFSFNFPSNLIELIMTCISSISSTLLFNRGNIELFRALNGVLGKGIPSPLTYLSCAWSTRAT